MISFANAKLNLGLFVTEKRSDGFHNIESIFLPVSVSDVLEILPSNSDTIEFKSVGIEINGDEKMNLCVRAYNLLKKDLPLPGIKACLLKNIPIGAGLGGGSSDGVTMIKMLNEKFELNISEEKLLSYAAELGSDCPFFVHNKALFVSGRGEEMHSIDLDLKGTNVIVVHPGVHISTPEAYRLVQPKKPSFDLKRISFLAKTEWMNEILNDFEKPMADKFPQINSIKNILIQNGAYYASMTGSGSAVYGLFEQEKNLEHLFKGYFYRNAEIL